MATSIDLKSLEGLQAVINRFIAAHEQNDTETQLAILRRFAAFEKARYAVKVAKLAELKRLMAVTEAPDDDAARVEKVIAAFEFCAELDRLASDELDDLETQHRAVDSMHKLAAELDVIPPEDRGALAVLLDNANLAVRASAGAFVWRIMPERALPVLREVHRAARGTSAGFTAMWALSAHEMETKGD